MGFNLPKSFKSHDRKKNLMYLHILYLIWVRGHILLLEVHYHFNMLSRLLRGWCCLLEGRFPFEIYAQGEAFHLEAGNGANSHNLIDTPWKCDFAFLAELAVTLLAESNFVCSLKAYNLNHVKWTTSCTALDVKRWVRYG